MENNKIMLTGEVKDSFKFEYECFGEKFYSLYLNVYRESGTCDCLKIICSDRLFNIDMDLTSKFVDVVGSIRTFNKREKDGSCHLKIYVFAEQLYLTDNQISKNLSLLDGYICKKEKIRTTPLGRTICDVILAVNTIYGKSYYIPCIFWGRNASYVDKLEIGSHITINGRLQSRNYVKEDKEMTVYELSASFIEVKDGASNGQ